VLDIKKKKPEPYCKNCLLFDKDNKMCKVSILINGEKFNMPVDPEDKCHMDMLKIPVQQIRWYEEPSHDGQKKVKVEYPVDLELGKNVF
jgi:hypothetical protein